MTKEEKQLEGVWLTRTDKNHAALCEAYEQLMMFNGVHNPPAVMLANDMHGHGSALALPALGMIVVDRSFAERSPITDVLSVISHEVGHLLGNHTVGITQGNKLGIKDTLAYRSQELEADRLAVSLMGSRDAIFDMRSSFSPGGASFEAVRRSNTIPSEGFANKIKRGVSRFMENASHVTVNGYPEERRRNIASVNLDDRSHLERLTEARDANITASGMEKS